MNEHTKSQLLIIFIIFSLIPAVLLTRDSPQLSSGWVD